MCSATILAETAGLAPGEARGHIIIMAGHPKRRLVRSRSQRDVRELFIGYPNTLFLLLSGACASCAPLLPFWRTVLLLNLAIPPLALAIAWGRRRWLRAAR